MTRRRILNVDDIPASAGITSGMLVPTRLNQEDQDGLFRDDTRDWQHVTCPCGATINLNRLVDWIDPTTKEPICTTCVNAQWANGHTNAPFLKDFIRRARADTCATEATWDEP
jgi:hypothetical protein